MTEASFIWESRTEVSSVVKAWPSGGGYVSVPGKWKGKKVKVILVEGDESDREE